MKSTIIKALILILALSCKESKPELNKNKVKKNNFKVFTLLDSQVTNIEFQNELKEGLNANVLVYEYLYNGGGVATGDFNNDGAIDIYFSSNMGENKLYLNQGNFQFLDATTTSHVSGRSGPWKTGVSATDVNGDGKLDLYVCYSGALPPQKRANQLFINMGNNEDGTPIFEEKASEYGLNSSGFSNQGYFFDYDHDGDLDMILVNHNPKSLPILNEASTAQLLKKDDPLKGVRLFENENNIFNDVTINAGISSSSLTYGLSAGIADLNNDGWQDFYLSNDYSVPDYLYINNQDGSFTNTLKSSMGHISQFSMGNDIADINNDQNLDVFTLDMLPKGNERQKLLLAPDNYDKFDLNVRSGFHYQYMRNMLQLNNGDGTYSEIGQLAGVSNTDWSWSALFADYDNDGWKDLFVTNGYYRDYTNLDFINYMEDYIKSKGRLKRQDVLEIISKMPSSNVSNYFFKNHKGIDFSDETKDFGLGQKANSNGAAYADFDNDGDLDLVVNNINKPAFVYRNESQLTKFNYLRIALKGEGKNTNGIGAKVTVYNEGRIQVLEQSPTRGYLSTVSVMLNFGLGLKKKIDSLSIRWNNGKYQSLKNITGNQTLVLEEKNAIVKKAVKKQDKPYLSKVSAKIDFDSPQLFGNDFKRQSLLISQLSHTGVKMAKADVNDDGLQDVLITGVKGKEPTLFVQLKNGSFRKKFIFDFVKDKGYHDTDVVFFDANNDSKIDVYITSGGYHDIDAGDAILLDRLYLGDANGNFKRSLHAIPKIYQTSSCVAVSDMNKDGNIDIFVGGSVVPGSYPENDKSHLLLGDGKGKFTDQTGIKIPEFSDFGIVKDAVWADINGDQMEDLVVASEWKPLTVWINSEGKLKNKTDSFFESNFSGWWNTIEINDYDNDGALDIMAGNMGLNTQFQASRQEPTTLFYADFDKNGAVDPLFCYYIEGKNYPYLTRDELTGQMVGFKSKYTSYKSYANKTINDIFTINELNDANKLTSNYMKTALFLRNSEGKFVEKPLPIQAQFGPVTKIISKDINSDGQIDLILFGNKHDFKLRLGRFDANYGMLLFGNGKGDFKYISQKESGLSVRGEVTSTLVLKDMLLIATNNNSLKWYKLSDYE